MTHDELLASLTLPLDGSYYEQTQFKRTNALRAVVELHMPNTAAEGNICFCGGTYPCLTIQAIEKELK